MVNLSLNNNKQTLQLIVKTIAQIILTKIQTGQMIHKLHTKCVRKWQYLCFLFYLH